MLYDAINGIVQLVKIGTRQLHLSIFIGMPVENPGVIIIAFRFIYQLTVAVHHHQLVIWILIDVIDLQKVFNTVAVRRKGLVYFNAVISVLRRINRRGYTYFLIITVES